MGTENKQVLQDHFTVYTIYTVNRHGHGWEVQVRYSEVVKLLDALRSRPTTTTDHFNPPWRPTRKPLNRSHSPVFIGKVTAKTPAPVAASEAALFESKGRGCQRASRGPQRHLGGHGAGAHRGSRGAALLALRDRGGNRAGRGRAPESTHGKRSVSTTIRTTARQRATELVCLNFKYRPIGRLASERGPPARGCPYPPERVRAQRLITMMSAAAAATHTRIMNRGALGGATHATRPASAIAVFLS